MKYIFLHLQLFHLSLNILLIFLQKVFYQYSRKINLFLVVNVWQSALQLFFVVSSTIISPPSSLCNFKSNAGVAGLLVGIPVILFAPAKGVPENDSLVPFTIVILLPAELVIVRLPPAVPLAVVSVILAALISAAISTASAAVVPKSLYLK